MTDPATRQREHFDAIAVQYATARSHSNHLAFKHLLWNEFLKGKHDIFGTKPKVLEPMCGAGDGYALLAKHLQFEISYEGFDLSAAMIEAARARHPAACIAQADVTRFRPKSVYDLVLILGGLHHVPHAATQVVATLSRAVRPGGYFLSWEPTHGNAVVEAIRERIYQRNAVFESDSERAFAVRELCDMFESAGFRLVDIMYPGLLGYVLYYNPDAFPMLNVGTPALVRALWALERPFMRTWLARKLSFATLSLWQRI